MSDWTGSLPSPGDHAGDEDAYHDPAHPDPAHPGHAQPGHDASHHPDGQPDAAGVDDEHLGLAAEEQPDGALELPAGNESVGPTDGSPPEWSEPWSEEIADHEYDRGWLQPDTLPQPLEATGGGEAEPGVPGPVELAEWAARAWQAEFGDDPTVPRATSTDTAALLADLAERAVDGQRQAASRAALGMIAEQARDAAEGE